MGQTLTTVRNQLSGRNLTSANYCHSLIVLIVLGLHKVEHWWLSISTVGLPGDFPSVHWSVKKPAWISTQMAAAKGSWICEIMRSWRPSRKAFLGAGMSCSKNDATLCEVVVESSWKWRSIKLDNLLYKCKMLVDWHSWATIVSDASACT